MIQIATEFKNIHPTKKVQVFKTRAGYCDLKGDIVDVRKLLTTLTSDEHVKTYYPELC